MDGQLDEVNIESIRQTLYKEYLEDFYHFCERLGGDTFVVMSEILKVCGGLSRVSNDGGCWIVEGCERTALQIFLFSLSVRILTPSFSPALLLVFLCGCVV